MGSMVNRLRRSRQCPPFVVRAIRLRCSRERPEPTSPKYFWTARQ